MDEGRISDKPAAKTHQMSLRFTLFYRSEPEVTSPVIPTERKSKPLIISSLDFFYALNWRVFGVLVIVLAFLDS